MRRPTRGDAAEPSPTSPPNTGQDLSTPLVDIVLADDLRTACAVPHPDDDEAHWAIRRPLLRPSRTCSAAPKPAPTSTGCAAPTNPPAFLGDCLQGAAGLACPSRKPTPPMMTAQPAAALRVARARPAPREGYAADVLVFDPGDRHLGARPASSSTTFPATHLASMPARSESSACWSTAWRRSATGCRTGVLPGTLLRSGRDTASVLPTPS